MDAHTAGSRPDGTLVHGPFHRRANMRTQSVQHMQDILLSGELWGRPARGSDIPSVKAFRGRLRVEDRGFEFWAFSRSAAAGGVVYWRLTDEHVWSDGEFAKMKILVSRVSPELVA